MSQGEKSLFKDPVKWGETFDKNKKEFVSQQLIEMSC